MIIETDSNIYTVTKLSSVEKPTKTVIKIINKAAITSNCWLSVLTAKSAKKNIHFIV